MDKIKYRLVFNRKQKLNSEGKGLIQIELYQCGRKSYISTNIHIYPQQWDKHTHTIINHENAIGLNAMMYSEITRIERIEIDLWKRGVTPTLNVMKQYIKGNNSQDNPLDFFQQYIDNSDRSKSSKQSMTNTIKCVRKHFGALRWEDINYNFVTQFELTLKREKMNTTTIAKQMEHLRTVINEAIRQGMMRVDDNPFLRYKIKREKPKHRYLTPDELKLIEKQAAKRNSVIIDAFLFCCYSGLRYSDMVTLKSEHIVKENRITWLCKQTIKTGYEVKIPISVLFGGKALSLIERYGCVEALARLPCNSTTNSVLKQFIAEIGIKKRVTFHTSRHTCATCLVHLGIPITTVQHILGHTKVSTTQLYSEILTDTILSDLKRCKFSK